MKRDFIGWICVWPDLDKPLCECEYLALERDEQAKPDYAIGALYLIHDQFGHHYKLESN